MKYIIARNNLTGWMQPLVFDESITHASVGEGLHRDNLTIVGAGFVDSSANVSGKSESLGIGPSPGDSQVLRFFLEYGVSGLQLANLVMLAGIDDPVTSPGVDL